MIKYPSQRSTVESHMSQLVITRTRLTSRLFPVTRKHTSLGFTKHFLSRNGLLLPRWRYESTGHPTSATSNFQRRLGLVSREFFNIHFQLSLHFLTTPLHLARSTRILSSFSQLFRIYKGHLSPLVTILSALATRLSNSYTSFSFFLPYIFLHKTFCK